MVIRRVVHCSCYDVRDFFVIRDMISFLLTHERVQYGMVSQCHSFWFLLVCQTRPPRPANGKKLWTSDAFTTYSVKYSGETKRWRVCTPARHIYVSGCWLLFVRGSLKCFSSSKHETSIFNCRIIIVSKLRTYIIEKTINQPNLNWQNAFCEICHSFLKYF